MPPGVDDGSTPSAEDFAKSRAALVSSLAAEITDERVIRAIGRVPRDRFVSPPYAGVAYEDAPSPIGHGQTTSQPTMIGIMLQELRLAGGERVLEVGTGSGYQTALLSLLAAEVVSVELIPALAESASRVLGELGYANLSVILASNVLGWPEDAPYDAIVVAAAAPRIPKSLVDQLAPGGRLVIPVGARDGQDLLVVQNTPEGIVVTRKGACRFVALIGPEAYPQGS